MTSRQQQRAARRAEGPTVIVPRCAIAGQPSPFLVTAARPLAEVAGEALPAADALLAKAGALLAVVGSGDV